ncbi:polysaccharide deacetylase [Paenibacillus koleovorans]|uniref:polysaccharide deacetylase n=1 Tax=Paenibacillus koleovorans TaxID=121608 RepID=UPI0013E328B0|nr:polysaccharide deacetylase [Paenibacillus koleovorans]
MRWFRLALTVCLTLLLLPLTAISAVWADGADGGRSDVYDRLKEGKRIPLERAYTQPEQPTVYLTFDDGPGPTTAAVLDILKEEGVPATFFVLGEQVRRSPELVRRIVEEGHALGNHTYNHRYEQLYPDFGGFWEQVEQTNRVLEETVGFRPSLVRAPGGTYNHFDAFYFYYLEQAGYSVFDWNVDSGDSLRVNVPRGEIAANAKAKTLKREMVVLMHDSAGHQESARALPEVIRYYRELGYRFAALDETVNPVQSSLSKSVKSKAMSRQEHERWQATAWERTASLSSVARPVPMVDAAQSSGDVPPPSLPEAQAPLQAQEQALSQPVAPPLELRLGPGEGERLTLDSAAYEFKHEKLYVPLRALTEKMGALVTWDGERRTASVAYGMYVMTVDLKANTMSVEKAGKTTATFHLADVKLKDGSVIVPLRSTVELLGGQVESFAFSDTLREVSLDVNHKGYGVLWPGKLDVRV